jgi:hypothetical protein
MLDTADFFEKQIKDCTDTAQDREFWLKMANRWEGLLQARQTRGAPTLALFKGSVSIANALKNAGAPL